MTDLLSPLLALVTSLLSPAAPPPPPPPPPIVQDHRTAIECIGRFESNGNYLAVSPTGRYRGKYQMSTEFFLQYGGDRQFAGRHEQAPPAMQDQVALNGYRARGFAPWPGAQEVCGTASAG